METGESVSPSEGLSVSGRGTSVNLDGESFRHLTSSIFNTENFGKMLKYGTVIAIACVIAKIAKDRWNKPPDDSAPDKPKASLLDNRGKYTLKEEGTKTYVNRQSAGDVPLTYNGPNAEANVQRKGGEFHYTEPSNERPKHD